MSSNSEPAQEAQVVIISYDDLFNRPDTLLDAISRAFGSDPNCLGLIVVDHLPQEYASLRLNLLNLADKFAALDEHVREKYSDPRTHYSFGWSHGKEIMNGKPDLLKGSYYANVQSKHAISQVPPSEAQQFPEYYSENIWPEPEETDVVGLKDAFDNLGQFILDVGCQLAKACQPFVSSQLLDSSSSLYDMIKYSHTTKGRLLHYFSPSEDGEMVNSDGSVDACGYHLDHSLLTGLCSALYLAHEDGLSPTLVSSPSPLSGLYIKTRGGNVVKATFPATCLAFQVGEALEIATGGKLHATPHYVRVDMEQSSKRSITRETFALFMQPDTATVIGGGETFGQFSKRVFEEHYESTM